jgi:type I restriction enzyme, S subunit
MSFKLSSTVNPSKVFIEQKTNVTGRWDPFYFRPELVVLEKRVRKVTPHRLREFVRSMAGGATPSTTEADTHYTEAEDGVPFIRVQNLSTTGKLNLEDCKRITRGTHEGLLKRSRLSGGELLVKITGVGRMAVASVVPEGFEGNINQHIVAIRTNDIATSETLAAYLNLDMAERLASRRSTGGTRPALDYPALLSIPVVVDDRIPELMKAAVERHQSQTKKADKLLATIDDVLLDELGIPHQPEPPNTLESRIFQRRISETTGERLDPHFHRPKFEELTALLLEIPHATMRELVHFSAEQWDQKSIFEGTFPYIEIGSVDLALGRLAAPPLVPVAEAANRAKMLIRPGDLLISLTRPTRKAICFSPNELELAVASNGFCVVRGFKKPDLKSRYLFHILRSRLCTDQFDQRSSGGNYPAITEDQLSKVIVPIVPPAKQDRIAKLLDAQYSKVERLYAEARADLEKAKRDIEALILGKDTAK